MDEIQRKYVVEIVEEEGFDYAFVSYSDFKEIESGDFHEARNNYLNAREKLAEILEYDKD